MDTEMNKSFDFIVGDCGQVYQEVGKESQISLTFLPYLVDIDGRNFEDEPAIRDAMVVNIGPITPEQAYLLGKSLLLAAKANGVSE
ncbi:hypothetical protein BN2910_52140 [Achromobacter xylosoxidans]|nr:hypothetical protein BN2910_52140 [Achromobacter xylosoxidans]